MAEKKDIKVEKVISDAEKGILHWDYYERWQEFKKEWSEEDKRRWNEITGRMHKNRNGKMFLDPPLTDNEKVWAMDIMRKAMEWGFS